MKFPDSVFHNKVLVGEKFYYSDYFNVSYLTGITTVQIIRTLYVYVKNTSIYVHVHVQVHVKCTCNNHSTSTCHFSQSTPCHSGEGTRVVVSFQP